MPVERVRVAHVQGPTVRARQRTLLQTTRALLLHVPRLVRTPAKAPLRRTRCQKAHLAWSLTLIYLILVNDIKVMKHDGRSYSRYLIWELDGSKAEVDVYRAAL